MSLSWLSGDSIAPAESEVSLAQCKLVTRELGGYCLVSRQLVEDGGETLGAYLEILLGKTVAFYIQKAGFNGTGTGGQPLGIINSPGSAVVNRSTPSSFVAADGDAMLAKLLPASMKHAWWCVSPSAFGKMSGLTSFYPAVVANENGLRVEASGMFRGLPVFVSETLPDLGTKGDVCLVDPRACLVGERRETEVSWSKEAAINGLPTAYIANQSIIRTWWRGGLEPLWQKTATLANGVTGVSPIVVLN
jgi:HK97 family phage major capsid protein